MAKRVGPRKRHSRKDADRALAVAYVNVAVAIAAIEHQLERLISLIQQMAPHPEWAPRSRGAVGNLPRERKDRHARR